MVVRLLTLLMAPLLIVQGRYVRRVTPRLPEPEGERAGVRGHGPELHILLLGDSAAAGVGVTTQAEALAGCVVNELAADHRVRWRLEARTGDAVGELVERVEQATHGRADVVLVSVGVNDVTGRTSDAQWRRRLRRLVHLLRERQGARHILLSAVPPMDRFTALPQPLRLLLGARARQLDRVLREIAAADAACEWLDVPVPRGAGAIAADGFHPGPLAYAAWGRAAALAVRRRRALASAPGDDRTG
jgi:lysophospholipase L1-like esterase